MEQTTNVSINRSVDGSQGRMERRHASSEERGSIPRPPSVGGVQMSTSGARRSGSSLSQSSTGTDGMSRRRQQKQAQLAAAAAANAAQMEELQKLLAAQRMLMEAHASMPSAPPPPLTVDVEALREEKERHRSERRERREREKQDKRAERERVRRERKERLPETQDATVGDVGSQAFLLPCVSLETSLTHASPPYPSPPPPSDAARKKGSISILGTSITAPVVMEVGQRMPSPLLISTDEHLAATSVNTLMPIVPVGVGVDVTDDSNSGLGGTRSTQSTTARQPAEEAAAVPPVVVVPQAVASVLEGVAYPSLAPSPQGEVQRDASPIQTTVYVVHPAHELVSASVQPSLDQPIPFHAGAGGSPHQDPPPAPTGNKSLTIIVEGGTSDPAETRAAFNVHSSHLKKRRGGGAVSPSVRNAAQFVPVPASPMPSGSSSPSNLSPRHHLSPATGLTPNTVSLEVLPPVPQTPPAMPIIMPLAAAAGPPTEASPRSHSHRDGGLPPIGEGEGVSISASRVIPHGRKPQTVLGAAASNASGSIIGANGSGSSAPSSFHTAAGGQSGSSKSESTSTTNASGGAGNSVYTLNVPVVVRHLRTMDTVPTCVHFQQWALTAHPQLLESIIHGRDVLAIVTALGGVMKQSIPFLEAMLNEDASAPLGDGGLHPADHRDDDRGVSLAQFRAAEDGSINTPRMGKHQGIGMPRASLLSFDGAAVTHPSLALERLFDGFFVDSFGDEMPAIGTADESSFFVDGFVKELERSMGRQLPDDELRQWYSFLEVLMRPNRNGPLSPAAIERSKAAGEPIRLMNRNPNTTTVRAALRGAASAPREAGSNVGSMHNGSSSLSRGGTSSGANASYEQYILQQSREPAFITLARAWLPRYAAQLEEAYRQHEAGQGVKGAVAPIFAPVHVPVSDVDSIKYGWTLIIKTTRGEFGHSIVREMLIMMPALGRTGPLRNANPQQLGAQIELMFGSMVGSLGDVLSVIPSILQLGARHVGYGLTAEYAEVFVTALDVTLARLLKEETYTATARAAWEGLARFMLEVMSAGAMQPLPDKKRRRRGRDANQQSLSSVGGPGETCSTGSSRSRRSISSLHSTGVSSRSGSQFHGHVLNPNGTTHIKASTESMLSYERSLTTSNGSINVLDDNTTTLLQLFREVLRSDVTALLGTFDELLGLCMSDLTASARFAQHIIINELRLVPTAGNGVDNPASPFGKSTPFSQATFQGQQPQPQSAATAANAKQQDTSSTHGFTHHAGFDSFAIVGMLLRYVSLLRTIFTNRGVITIAAVKRALLFYRFFGFESFEPVRLLLNYVGGGRLRFELCMQRVVLPLSAIFDSARGSDDFIQPARVLRECWSMVSYRELVPQLLFMISGQLSALPNMASWRTPSHFMRKVQIMGLVEIINVICGVHGIDGSSFPTSTLDANAANAGGPSTTQQVSPQSDDGSPSVIGSPSRQQQQQQTEGTESADAIPVNPAIKLPPHALVLGVDVQRACARLGLWLRVLGLEEDAERVVDIVISSLWDVLQNTDSTKRYMLSWSFKHCLSAMVQCGALPYPSTMADRRLCDIHWQMVLRKLNSKEIGVTGGGGGFGVQLGGGAYISSGSVTIIDELIRLMPSLRQGLFRRVSINALNEVHKRFMTKVVDTALYGGSGTMHARGGPFKGNHGGFPAAAEGSLNATSNATTRRSIANSLLAHDDENGRRDSTVTTSDSATVTTVSTSDHSTHRNVVSLVIPTLGPFGAAPSGGFGHNGSSRGGHQGGSSFMGDTVDGGRSDVDDANNAFQTSDLPLHLPPGDEEELRLLGLQHTIWGVLEEHYPVFITAFMSYLRLLHIQNPAVMPPVAIIPVTSWLTVVHYLATKMSGTAASAREMLHKHSDKATLQKIILIQSLQRGRMARSDVHKRRVFQDGIVRSILGMGPVGGAPALPAGIPPEVGTNRYRQQAYFRMLEINRERAKRAAENPQQEAKGRSPNTSHLSPVGLGSGSGGNGSQFISNRKSIANALQQERQRAQQFSRTGHGGSDNSDADNPVALNSYNRRPPMDGSGSASMSQRGGGAVNGLGLVAFGIGGRGLGGSVIPINTVHVRDKGDDPYYDEHLEEGNDGRDGAGNGPKYVEEDDGLDWEVLDGEISPGLDRLLALLWASMGSQGRSGAVHGALREYSERYQRRLFGSSSAGRLELRQAGELILQMMAYYGRLDEAAHRSAATNSTGSGTVGSQRSVVLMGSHEADRHNGHALRRRAEQQGHPMGAPPTSDSPFMGHHAPPPLPLPPFVLRRLYQHDPSLHNLSSHHRSRYGPSPLMPFHNHQPMPPNHASPGGGGPASRGFRHQNVAEPLVPSPPPPQQGNGAKGGKASRKRGRGAKAEAVAVNGGGVLTGLGYLRAQKPMLPTGEVPLNEVGLEEMIILFEDADFGHILIERILAACPDEHRHHPAVRLAWLQLHSCILYNLKVSLDPSVGSPKRTQVAMMRRSQSPQKIALH